VLNPSLTNIKEAFHYFFELLCDENFVKTHGESKLWLGEKGFLVPLRFFIAARFWDTYPEDRGWQNELLGSRVDFLIGNIAVEVASSTMNGNRERITAKYNHDELRKFALSTAGTNLLVLYDLSGNQSMSDESLNSYRSSWLDIAESPARLNLLYCYQIDDVTQPPEFKSFQI
jgi:hypothetical protein